MSGNLYGNEFRIMTFGESHGPYIGLVIDGVKPNLPLDIESIQKELDRRRPGQSDVVTPRKETDQAQIVSGIFEGKTTGTPICILIKNQDQHSNDYKKLKNILRPGHANYTFLRKYGIFDYRGGGRASGRETATRVAAGAVAKQFLKERNIKIIAYTKQISNIKIKKIDFSAIEKNAVRAPDPEVAKKMVEAILKARAEGDSLGGIIEIVVKNCPAGLGEPVFNKLPADLAQSLLSIGAVKAFEMGSGFKAAVMRGSEHNDKYYFEKNKRNFRTKTNNAGGVIGGITNGEDLIMRITIKPPSSINIRQETVNFEGEKVPLEIGGRHDPCICPRIVPVAEGMVALVLLDHLLMQERLSRESESKLLFSKIKTIDTQLLLMLVHRHQLMNKISQMNDNNTLDLEKNIEHNLQTVIENIDLPNNKISKLLKIILEN